MAEDREPDAPSLEPPSLFGRKRKRAPAPAADSAPGAVAPQPSSTAEPVAQPPLPSVAEPAEPTEPTEPTTIFEADPEPAPEPVPEPVPVGHPEPVAVAPQPSSTPAPVAGPPLPGAAEEDPELTGELEEREPWLTGGLAAVITGLLVGLVIVALTAGGLRLCTKVKGTDSCGGPGLFLLIAILVVAVLVGAALLRAARVPEPTSTSFLAVGLLSVITLLFLVGSIFQWWMIIAIPIVSIATYSLSHWVTTTYIEPSRD